MSLSTRIIYTREDMLLAFQEASQLPDTLVLSSPEAAIAFAGAGYYQAMLKNAQSIYPNAKVKFILDCSIYPGWVMSALRQGVRCISFSGNSEITEKICHLAQFYNAEIIFKNIILT
ncbi:MAG: hypothetical protein IBJ00_00305 [Alphaproteobacteria bacterium]|nr:hypothetical protein [Alphaproteobacteria bacterium]